MTKAAVVHQLGGDFEIWDVELAAPRSGEVIVRLAATGICHSDASIHSGMLPFISQFPVVLGHEGSGVVEEVGPGVTSVGPGDHVVMSFKPFCGDCWYCQHGEGYLCTAAFGDGQPTLFAGDETVHTLGTPTFVERTVVPEHCVVKIRPDASLEAAALLGCGVMTGFGAATNTASIEPGETVAIIGCGGVGLSAIQGARHAGAEEVIAIDLVESKLALAKSMGATHAIRSADIDVVAAVKDLTGGRGVDHAFEVIGLPRTIGDAVAMTRPGGETVLVGLPELDVSLDVNVLSLILDNRRIVGSMYGSCNFPTEVGHLLDLYDQGSLQLDELISRRLPLERIQEGFDALKSGEVARSVIVFSEAP
jgi:S-(hydroxymethyl)glutathione dehydrogenase / alcohol dehydrogenase